MRTVIAHFSCDIFGLRSFRLHFPSPVGNLCNALGNITRRLETQLIRDLSERDSVIAGILCFVHKLNDCIGRVGPDQLNELLLLEILICRPDVKYTASYTCGRRIEDQLDCPGGVTDMYVRAPELLAKYFEVLSGEHLHGELVHGQVEPHAWGYTINCSEPQRRRAPAIVASHSLRELASTATLVSA